MQGKDWQDQLALCQTTYEEFFPDLNENNPSFAFHSNSLTHPTSTTSLPRKKQIKKEKESDLQYSQLLQDHSFSLLDLSSYQSSGRNISDPNRRYSVTSSNYFNTLDQLELQFSDLTQKIYNLENQTINNEKTREKILNYQSELAQLLGHLDKFQVFFYLIFHLHFLFFHFNFFLI